VPKGYVPWVAPESEERILCDALGCDETYPVHHDSETEDGFLFGRWPGWVYLDINRNDLIERPLRFCGVRCLLWWCERETVVNRPERPAPPPPLEFKRTISAHIDRQHSEAKGESTP
jgi:hypothetical protein